MSDTPHPPPPAPPHPPSAAAGLAAALVVVALVTALRHDAAVLAAATAAGAWIHRVKRPIEPLAGTVWRAGSALVAVVAVVLSLPGAVIAVALVGAVDARLPIARFGLAR